MADPTRTVRRLILGLLLLGGLCLLLAQPPARGVDNYRGVLLVRGYGLFLFTWPLLPLLLVAVVDCLRHRIRFPDTPTALWLTLLVVFWVVVLGMYDSGRSEPNLSRRLLPVVLPVLLLGLATLVARRLTATTRRFQFAYYAAVGGFALISLAQFAPFLCYRDYDSLNAPVAAIGRTGFRALVVDFPAGLIDTPLRCRDGIEVVLAERLGDTPDSWAAALGLLRTVPAPGVGLLRTELLDGSAAVSNIPNLVFSPEFQQRHGFRLEEVAAGPADPAPVFPLELSWEDICTTSEHLSRTVTFPARRAPHRVIVRCYRITFVDEPT